ncbi:hypothetical protein IMX26_15950 [Clostridium sp. 'deep sea']|uniref:hypothetical protein n=1 Tax=Clostridium sp. 'deep sea' TaxID=2779445 RepID=UPI0018966A87|nr:hypothetical protein [Clostridium sp. 'deep sea']QOR34931.1 hypothetical protein IMX26_15950 [Clostridium sp. 'deep sea']
MSKLKSIENIQVIPYEGIGRIKLGLTELQIKNIIKTHYSNKKVNNDIVSAPFFEVEYNEQGEAIYIELARDDSNKDLYPTLFKGIDIFNTKAKDLIPQITKYYEYNSNDINLGYSYVFPAIDLALWRPSIFEEEDKQEDWFKGMCQESQQFEIRHMYFCFVAVAIKDYYSSAENNEDIMNLGSNKSYCELKESADHIAIKYNLQKP